ncbi:hypothetical protein Glove_123g166 [Diversispora epigaea]|uniref:Uncharacterized protein n=1 Tax=Diversispora epigaea TaxID=1348612 RepID=A0A397IYM3_9GLOM|nr:hypothetical protein Glove_123g166 [Diversispora epigaea]
MLRKISFPARKEKHQEKLLLYITRKITHIHRGEGRRGDSRGDGCGDCHGDGRDNGRNDGRDDGRGDAKGIGSSCVKIIWWWCCCYCW